MREYKSIEVFANYGSDLAYAINREVAQGWTYVNAITRTYQTSKHSVQTDIYLLFVKEDKPEPTPRKPRAKKEPKPVPTSEVIQDLAPPNTVATPAAAEKQASAFVGRSALNPQLTAALTEVLNISELGMEACAKILSDSGARYVSEVPESLIPDVVRECRAAIDNHRANEGANK